MNKKKVSINWNNSSFKKKLDNFLNKIKWWFEAWRRYIVFFDSEWRNLIEEIEFFGDYKKDKELLEKQDVKQILKKIPAKDIAVRVHKMKINDTFLIHFFSMISQQKISENWKYVLRLNDALEKLKTQDIQNFEIYQYILEEKKTKAKKISEILEDVPWFKPFLSYLFLVEKLPDSEKYIIFDKIVERIKKKQEIKWKIISPLIQPTILIWVVLLIFITFSQWLLKSIVGGMEAVWYSDKIPWLVVFSYTFWNFLYNYWLLILFIIFIVMVFLLELIKFSFIKQFIERLLLNFSFYKYFNELFMWYVFKIQDIWLQHSWKLFADIIEEIKEWYKDNYYYYFFYNMIYIYYKKWLIDYIKYYKYSYVFTPEFISNLELIVKQWKPALIQNYIDVANKKIDEMTHKFASILSLIWLITISVSVLILFLSMFLWNQTKSDLIQKQAKGELVQIGM